MKQLRLFCLRSLLFAATMIVASYACNALFLDKLKAYFPYFGGADVYRAILKSKKKVEIKKLIIGDSTANQIFDNREGDAHYYSLANNQAVGVCGQYLLLHNFLQAGNRPEEVYMLFHPGSFSNNLNQTLTYHYFLKPFYRDEYKDQLSEYVVKQIEKIPFHEFSQLPLTIGAAWAPNIELDAEVDSLFSPISIEYLAKMDSLREEYHFRLYLVPTLTAESKKHQIVRYDYAVLAGTHMAKLLKIYSENIKCLPDDCFQDSVHLFNPLEYKGAMLDEMRDVKEKVDAAS